MLKCIFSFFLAFPCLSAIARADNQQPGIEQVTLATAGGNIYGTLTLPGKKQRMPVVLIIAGSGPTDRDGNSPLGVSAQPYKMLADSLLQHGIACLRYDKRGVAASAAAMRSESELTFKNMIDDAEGWIKWLKADGRFSKLIVLGHSEGSLIGMVAAREAHADRYISVAGAGDRADRVISKQMHVQMPQLADKIDVLFDSLTRGYTVQEPGGVMNMLFRSSVQPYLISWFKYDPPLEIRQLTMPVLILQGRTDLQVSVEDAQALKKAKPDATLTFIDGMNHILKQATDDRQQNIATYKDPDRPLKPELVTAIVGFVYHSGQ